MLAVITEILVGAAALMAWQFYRDDTEYTIANVKQALRIKV